MTSHNDPQSKTNPGNDICWEFLLHSVPDAMAIADLNSGELLAINDGFSQLTGFSSKQVIGRSVAELNLFANPRKRTQFILELFESGSVTNFEAGFRCQNQDYLTALLSARVTERDGRSLVVTVAREIDDLKLAQQALQESEERYRLIFENIQDVYFEASVGGILLEVSPSITLCSGFSRSELIGSFLHDNWFADLQFQGLVDHLLAQNTVVDHEIIFLDQQNRRRYGSVNASLTLSSEGRPLKIIGSMRDITEAKNAQEKIRQLAYYDALTALPNRSLFYDRLGQALTLAARHDDRLALLYLDLDGFKQVNDSLGHDSGDILLKKTAQRLKQCVRHSDTVARLGGDEFVILIPDEATAIGVSVVAEKILDSLGQPFHIAGQEVFVGASIGIVLYPDDGDNGETLVSNADMAMYAAKNAGRHNFQFFCAEINHCNQNRRQTELDLRQAMQNQELEVVFQPRLDLAGQKMAGIVALLRWVRSDGAIIEGQALKDCLDQAGLAREVAVWLLNEACEKFSSAFSDGKNNLHLTLALPAGLLRQNDFLTLLDGILQRNKLPGELLEIEIDEELLSRDLVRTEALLVALKKLGVGLVIEGFGSGQLPLTNLREDLIDGLKIPAQLIAEVMVSPRHAALVKTLISMAKIMGLKTIAQGVDDQALYGFLRYHKCDRIQGLHYLPPMRGAELADSLSLDWKSTSL